MPSFEHDDAVLTEGQYRAAQMFIARLLAEADGSGFDFEDIGLHWALPDRIPVGYYDDGTVVSVGDVMYGAMVLIWSTIIDRSEIAQQPVLESLSRLGLGLAMHSPS